MSHPSYPYYLDFGWDVPLICFTLALGGTSLLSLLPRPWVVRPSLPYYLGLGWKVPLISATQGRKSQSQESPTYLRKSLSLGGTSLLSLLSRHWLGRPSYPYYLGFGWDVPLGAIPLEEVLNGCRQ